MCCLLFNRNLTEIKILPMVYTLCATCFDRQTEIRKYKSKNLIPVNSLEFLPEASQQNSKAAQSSCIHKPSLAISLDLGRVWPRLGPENLAPSKMTFKLCKTGKILGK